MGGGGREKRAIIYLSLHCHHQNDSCIKTGSDESHFNVLLIVRGKVTGQCPRTTTLEEKGEPKRNRTEVPLVTSPAPYRLAANLAHSVAAVRLQKNKSIHESYRKTSSVANNINKPYPCESIFFLCFKRGRRNDITTELFRFMKFTTLQISGFCATLIAKVGTAEPSLQLQ